MPRIYQIKPSQLVSLRNDLIIAEALELMEKEVPAIEDDYNDYATFSKDKVSGDKATPEEISDSEIYGIITKELYDYSKNLNLPTKIATSVESKHNNISAPSVAHFIEKLLYGIYRMSEDPSLNVGFERLLRGIGVTAIDNLLLKDNTPE